MKSSSLLLWTARIWGTLAAVFLLFMIAGHLFGSEPQQLNNPAEGFALVFFPTGLLIGLLLAYKSPRWGGWIATLSMAVTYSLMPEVLTNWYFAALTVPGVLYLLAGLSGRKKAEKV